MYIFKKKNTLLPIGKYKSTKMQNYRVGGM